jgi:hypothetical protein
MKPHLGQIVIYRSKIDNGPGNYVLSPAIVLRTRDTTVAAVTQRWTPDTWPVTKDHAGGDHEILPRPAGLVAELPDDTTVDLAVLGLGRIYHEYAVPHGHRRGQWSRPDHTNS